MACLSKSKILAVAAGLATLAACSPEYNNNWDTVSYRAGDAVYGNQAIHTISPWPPNVENTNVQAGD